MFWYTKVCNHLIKIMIVILTGRGIVVRCNVRKNTFQYRLYKKRRKSYYSQCILAIPPFANPSQFSYIWSSVAILVHYHSTEKKNSKPVFQAIFLRFFDIVFIFK